MINNTSKSAMAIEKYGNGNRTTLPLVLEDIAARFILTCPDEEFASFERLFFQIEAAHWFYIDNCVESDPSLPNLGLKEFARRLFQHCPMLTKFQASVEAHLQKFSQYKVCVPVYGAIILNPSMEKCLLVKGWSKNSTWGFPKGKINKNEPEISCAAREVFEEVGFDVSALISEENTITATINNNDQEQTIKLYIIPGVSEDTVFETQTRKEISKICWFAIKDLPVSKMPGRDFFLVRPFVKQLNEWIKSHKVGKARLVKQSILGVTSLSTKVKESRRTASEPSQRPKGNVNHDPVRHNSEGQSMSELGHGTFSAEDMFRVNEERFGVKSTYQFELYTTPLKSLSAGKSKSKVDPHQSIPGGGYRQCTVPDMHVTSLTAQVMTDSLRLNSVTSALPSARAQCLKPALEREVLQARAVALGTPNVVSKSSRDRASPTNRKTPGAGHKASNTQAVALPVASPPSASEHPTMTESKRRKGAEVIQDIIQSGIVQLLNRDLSTGSSPLPSEFVQEVNKSCALEGNTEFGKNFRFNTLEVMAPILAMS